MSSPAKRRKKNNIQSSPQPGRSLDFFFGKQKKESDNVVETRAAAEVGHTQTAPLKVQDDVPCADLTDEEYARQLQDEWNKEGSHDQSQSIVGEKSLLPEYDGLSHHTVDELNSSKVVNQLQETCTGNSIGYEEKRTTLSLQSAAVAEDSITATLPFDENSLTFDPSKYLSKLRQQWDGIGGHASYGLLTKCFILVNGTQSRIKIVDTLVNLLRTIIEGDPGSLLSAVSR